MREPVPIRGLYDVKRKGTCNGMIRLGFSKQ